MSRRTLFICLVASLIVASCSGTGERAPDVASGSPVPAAQHSTLTIFAAASLSESFSDLARVFESHYPGTTAVLNFAGSQQLADQIDSGAPADVFASAAPDQVQELIASGEVAAGTEHQFASNRLVVVFPSDNPAGIGALSDLAKPHLRLILAAQEVPVGQYSLVFLDKASNDARLGPGFKNDVLRNVVSYEQNVRAVLTKVILGEADAGIVYTSDVTPQVAAQVGRLDIPDALNVPASYIIAPLRGTAQANLATAFISLVLSSEGQGILAAHGLLPVEQ